MKQEEIYTKEYDSVKELRESLQRYFDFDNRYPDHQRDLHGEGQDYAICNQAPENRGFEFDKIDTIV